MKKFLIITGIVLVFSGMVCAQQNSQPSLLLIGEAAPAFTANTTDGVLHFPGDFGDSWKILFSHPADFTPVCTSEILELALMQSQFRDLNVKFAVISTDQLVLHQSWVNSMNDLLKANQSSEKIEFPLIDDNEGSISRLYGMISPQVDPRRTIRGVFIIDPQNNIAATFFYPVQVGRNLEEIKRTVIALQTAKSHTVLTPVNWKPGEEVLLPYPFPYDSYESQKTKEGGYRSLSWYMLFKKLDNPEKE